MSAINNKLWVVLAVSAVLGIGFAVFAVKLVSEHKTTQVVTEQVDEWAKRWASARLCLAGDDSLAASAGHAYLLYEAKHTRIRDRLAGCDQFIRKLKRPGKESTGVAKVEKRWNELRTATKQLTSAYVGVVDKATRRPMGPRRARLVEALDGMDAAYARLRAESDMSPPTWPGEMRPAALPEGTALQVADAPLDAQFAAVRGTRLQAYGQTAAGRSVQVVMSGPDALVVAPQANGADIAADDALWGVWSTTTADNRVELRAGALDDNGAPRDAGVSAILADAPEQTLQVRFALGRDNDRAIVYETLTVSGYSEQTTGISVVRSSDGGQSFSAPVLLAARAELLRADTPNRRVDIAWVDDTDGAGNMRWVPLTADTLNAVPAPRRLFASAGHEQLLMCPHGAGAWWLRNGSELYHVADAQSPVRPVPLPREGVGDVAEIAACTARRVLFAAAGDGGMTLHSCDTQRCAAPMDVPTASDSQFFATTTGAGPLAVTRINQLVVAWRLDKQPRAYLAAAPLTLRGVLEWGGQTQLVSMPDDGGEIRLIPLPE